MSSGLYSMKHKAGEQQLDLKKLKPYGDTLNDGKIQLSFTLPVSCNDEAIEAAKQLMRKMGFENPQVVFYKELTDGFTFFNCYGTVSYTHLVEKIGTALEGKINLKPGDKIATLVSLSLTPLRIDKIKEIRKEVDQVDIEGKAILFESGIYAKIPDDMSEKLVLSALDVAGAPAQTAKLVKPGDTVFIIGAGGKSGMLCCYEAKKRTGVTGKVIGLSLIHI